MKNNNYNSKFSEWIRGRMVMMNKRVGELARELDTDIETVSRWRCGKQVPSMLFTKRLAKALAVKEETIDKKIYDRKNTR